MSKRKSKSEKHKKQPKTKISQKVIQQVIVKVGEQKKARRARRRSTLANKQQLNELMLQDRVIPNVIYQTGAPFQPPSVQPTITDAVRERSKEMKPNYLEIENPLVEIQPSAKDLKTETLQNFITPVSVISSTEFPPTSTFASMELQTKNEPLDSKIYSEAGRQQERVEGNYRFGETDVSAKAPSALYDNETLLKEKQRQSLLFGETIEYEPDMTLPLKQESEEEYVLAPVESSAKKQKKQRRTPEQILADKQNELQMILEQTGLAPQKAYDRSRLFNRTNIQDEIDFEKLNVKKQKKKSKKIKIS
jgi:hypothetical protein